MKKKLSALLCALCMAMALCLTAFATSLPEMTATATLSNDQKEITLVLGLAKMDGDYTALETNVKYDPEQVTFKSCENGDIFPAMDYNDVKNENKVYVTADGASKAGASTAATLTFTVNENVTGKIAFDVNGSITYYVAEGDKYPTTTAMAATSADVTVSSSEPEVKEYTVTVNQTGEGKVTLTNQATNAEIASGSSVEEGTNVVVKAEAATGYTLGEIEVNGAKVKSGDSLNITANTVINVTFTKNETPEPPATKTYKVTVDVKNATVEATPNKDIEAGTPVEITKAVANVGYELESIVVTNDTTKETVAVENNKFTMPESNVTITAVVKAKVYNISVDNKDEHGTIEAPKTAAYNSKVTVTAKPKDGYELKTVTITYIDAEGKTQTKNVGTTFTMPASNVTVTATFAKKSSGGSTTTTTPSSTNNKTTTVTATATATPAPTAQAKPAAAIPQTGDTANLALYAVLCVASAMALGYVVYRKKANH